MKFIQREKAYETITLTPTFERGRSFIWERDGEGRLLTNVALQAIEHSPTGFEIGYSGSGPADPALNAMAAIFPIIDESDESSVTRCFEREVSKIAYRLHQNFKFQFLIEIDNQEGEITWDSIGAWLKEHEVETSA